MAMVRACPLGLLVSATARRICPIFRISELGHEKALTRHFSISANMVVFDTLETYLGIS